MAIKLSEIARLANVSIATASYVLSGKGEQKGISEATTQRVEALARQHGFVPNRTAAFLKKGRYHLIALMAPHISEFYAGMLQSIEQEAEKRDYQILFSSTFDSVERERDYLRGLLARRVDGVILLPVDIHERHLRYLARNHVPTIFFRRRADAELPHKFMSFNDVLVGRKAAEHLVRQGCRTIAYCSAPIYVNQEYLRIIHEARSEACGEAVRAAGLPFDESHVVLVDRGRPETLPEVARWMLDRGVDGVVGISDDVSLAAMYALRDVGARIPEDVKVVGCNDSELAWFGVPPLTSVALPKPQLGRAMVEALFRMMDDGSQETDEVLLEPQVVARQSSVSTSTGRVAAPGRERQN